NGYAQAECVPAAEAAGGGVVNTGIHSRIIAVATAFVLICILAFSLVFALTSSKSYSVMSIQINPEVECVLDEDYNVVSVVSGNADGDLVLCDGFAETVVGLSCADAAAAITERAAKLGYFDLASDGSGGSYNKVTITVEGEKQNGSLADKLSSAVTSYFCEKGLYLYADVSSAASSAASEAAKSLAEANTFYCERIEETEDLADLVTQYAYSYIEELLAEALSKYDEGSYFTLLGDDDVEELRALLLEGITADNFGGIKNFTLRFNCYAFIGTEFLGSLADIIEDTIEGVVSSAETLLDNAYSLLASRAEAVIQRYESVYESLSQNSIDSDSYAEFLLRIGM
ncbi:MAG: hypothetical protein LUD27_04910, partial [Clostridia bacterium]|nr:hypothetical protein [Clostridia bacterium]